MPLLQKKRVCGISKNIAQGTQRTRSMYTGEFPVRYNNFKLRHYQEMTGDKVYFPTRIAPPSKPPNPTRTPT